MQPPPPAVRPTKVNQSAGSSVWDEADLWTRGPWCIPSAHPQTHSHNGHVCPHKRPVLLWSFLSNLSLLWCHLLMSSLVPLLSMLPAAWGATRARRSRPVTVNVNVVPLITTPTIIYQLIDKRMILNCLLMLFKTRVWTVWICVTLRRTRRETVHLLQYAV